MKKTIKKEVLVCDKCGKQCDYSEPCINCGTDLCFDCRKKHGKSYNHAVYFQGSGDGFYCNPCDVNLTKSGKDKRHSAYLAIKLLRDEVDAWSINFKMRQLAAEDLVKRFAK